MERYNYLEAVKAAVRDQIETHPSLRRRRDETHYRERLWDELINAWEVTGARSQLTAEENLCHNWELLKEAARANGRDITEDGPEYCDSAIRRYLLDNAIEAVDEEIIDEQLRAESKFEDAIYGLLDNGADIYIEDFRGEERFIVEDTDAIFSEVILYAWDCNKTVVINGVEYYSLDDFNKKITP